MARELEGLPQLARSLKDRTLNWSVVRELTRVVVPETQASWIADANGKSARQVEERVAGLTRGARPGDRPDDAVRRHVIRVEVSGETLATFREAVARLQRETDTHLDEDAALLAMARQVLGGPADPGRSGYQIHIDQCSHCGRATQRGRGESVSVGADVVEMAGCDAQRIDHTHVGTSATQTIPPAVRRAVMHRHRGQCAVPDCRNATFVDVHHMQPRAEGGGHSEENLVALCGAHHRAEHRGTLIIEGTVKNGLRFLHADGTVYGEAPEPDEVSAFSDAFLALRSLGFREGEIRSALDGLRGEPVESAGEVVKGALRLLHRRAPTWGSRRTHRGHLGAN